LHEKNVSKNNFGDKKEVVDKCIIRLHSLLTTDTNDDIK
jgi:hypothetical protein